MKKENIISSQNINDNCESTNYESKIDFNNMPKLFFSKNNFVFDSNDDSFYFLDENALNLGNILQQEIPKNYYLNQQKNEEMIIPNEKDNNNIFNDIILKKLKTKIFNIKKEIKLGRKKKSSVKKGKHDKYVTDNIIRKFKVHLLKNIFNFVNSCFLINKCKNKRKNIINVIKKLSSFDIKSISKEDNLKWLDTPLKIIFSQNITTKIINCDKNYNNRLIKRIYEKGEEKEVIEILNKTIREMWNIYINNSIEKNYIGFKTLKDDLNDLKKLGETDSYIKKYEYVSKEFENIFNRIIPRKRKNNF